MFKIDNLKKKILKIILSSFPFQLPKKIILQLVKKEKEKKLKKMNKIAKREIKLIIILEYLIYSMIHNLTKMGRLF